MACPDLTMVRTYKIDDIVWADCCRVFEQLEAVQSTIERYIHESLQSMLEHTHGSRQIAELKQEIAFASVSKYAFVLPGSSPGAAERA